MPIIEQQGIIEMVVKRNQQALECLLKVSDAVSDVQAGHPWDAKAIMSALGVVRVNGERAGRQARRLMARLDRYCRTCGSEVK